MVAPRSGRHAAEQRRRHDGVREGARYAAPDGVVAQDRAQLVAGQHPPRAVDHRGDGAAVGVGVVRDDDVRTLLLRERERQVDRALLLGVRERDRGEVGIRCRLLGDLAEQERHHMEGAEIAREENVGATAEQEEAAVARRQFILTYVQPGLAGLMDGSVSTLAPIFATAFATQNSWTAS